MGFLSLLFTVYWINISVVFAATDTLRPYQRLKDGQTLESGNQEFELGFFGPPNQTNIRYLGIWYKDVTPLTVVWVANRTKPIKNLDASLMLDFNGGLAIQDRRHNLVFLSMPSKTACEPILQILNSGNLVLRDDCNGYLWESFDYPSDTLLPGMMIGWDCKTGRNRVITSWKNSDDPQSGDFSFGLDTPRLPQLVLERSSIRESRWGPWDGARFSGTYALWTNPVFQPVFLTNSDGVHFTYNALNKSILVRLVVTPLGKVQFLTWKNYSKEWVPIVTLNKDSCDAYGSCGPYGICYVGELNCECLKGFTFNLSGGWTDWTAGCKRNFELTCDSDGFVEFTGLKLPDNGTVWANLGYNECEKNCLQECSCMAYTYLDVYANGTSACVVWLNDLFDMQNFPHGGGDLRIRMARAELELVASAQLEKNQNLFSIIISSTAAGMVLLGFLVAWCVFTGRQGPENCELNSSVHSNGTQEENQEFRLYDIRVISAATNNFSIDNKIGQGGFGPVYKGVLPTGDEVAVKRLSRTSRQGHEQFENESSLIARLQHRNLIKLFGCCVHEDERMLIYEYLHNKSLDNFIFDEARKRLLSWAKRFDIIVGVAKGLVYLHDDSGLRIVHRDLKAGNILLDGEMNPKISDFGLAKILGEENQPQVENMRVHGTHGYISPEYTMHGQFSTKSDVFSFGVLVLEIITGQKNWQFHHPDDYDLNLLGHVWNLWREGKALEIVDSSLGFEDSFSVTEMLRCINVGLLCAQNDPEYRPTMATVIRMLVNESIVLPEPKEPGFYPGTASVGIRPVSVNELTCTTLSAR